MSFNWIKSEIIQKIFTFVFVIVAILSTAASCSIPFFGGGNSTPQAVLGVLKRDPSIKKDGFNRANAVRAASGEVNVGGLSTLTTLKMVETGKDNLYLLTRDKGLFQSTDGAKTWERRYIFSIKSDKTNEQERNNEINQKIAKNDSFKVSDIAYDTSKPSTLYVSGKDSDTIGKIYQSSDSGQNFRLIYSEVEKNIGVAALTVDPRNPLRVYGILEKGALVRSLDGGLNWQKIRSFEETPLQFGFVPDFNNLFYALLPKKGLFLSDNDGQSWENKILNKTASAINENQNRDGINLNPLDRNETFGQFTKIIPVTGIGSRGGNQSWILLSDRQVWLTEDLNKPFAKLALPLQNEQNNILDVAFDPRKGVEKILVSLDNKLIDTQNKGISWNVQDNIQITDSIGNIRQILISRYDSEIIYLGLESTGERRGLFG
jgi:hypothetical protein